MSFKVIATLGPALLNSGKLLAVNTMGDCIYRINGAHVDGLMTRHLVEKARKILPSASMVMDLPGNKIRTSSFSQPIRLIKGETADLFPYQLNYRGFHALLQKGDTIYAQDGELRLEVVDVDHCVITVLSHSDGFLGANTGLHVRGIHEDIPLLFERDMELIDTASELGLDYVSASFVRTAADVRAVKRALAQRRARCKIIAKVETRSAVINLRSILEEVEAINVDRGDLSADVGISELPSVQEEIIRAGLEANKKVFLATQFLKSMVEKPVPLIAEIVDLYKTIRQGISGIQLSEETSVGRYPVECVKLVFDIYRGCQAQEPLGVVDWIQTERAL